jgi:ADP-dependent phosphofructokinase/glucokinase
MLLSGLAVGKVIAVIPFLDLVRREFFSASRAVVPQVKTP